MDRIRDSVHDELGRFGPAAGMADVVAGWPAAVGPAIARNAWPARIGRDGTLHVHTSSSAWAFELAQLEPTLRDRLRDAAGEVALRRLRFAVGPLPEPPNEAPDDAAASAPDPSPEDLAEAEKLAAAVGDENLRNLVARAASLSLAKARSGR